MLMRRWERARQRDGQLALIVGEPGLGKSRLILEFHARLRETPHIWVEWSCSQLLQNTPLHPIAEWGRMRFGSAEVPAEQPLAELESSLAQVKLLLKCPHCLRRFWKFHYQRNVPLIWYQKNYGVGSWRR